VEPLRFPHALRARGSLRSFASCIAREQGGAWALLSLSLSLSCEARFAKQRGRGPARPRGRRVAGPALRAGEPAGFQKTRTRVPCLWFVAERDESQTAMKW